VRLRALALTALIGLLGPAASRAQEPSTAAATPPVTVVYVRPERFTDVKGSCFGPDDRTGPILEELAVFMRETGRRFTPAGGALAITVTDVDLAGEFVVPVRFPQRCEARVYRDIYAPRIDLEFRLTDSTGRVVRADKRVLRDSNYLTRVALPPSDLLRHEKRLLLDWFESEFDSRGVTR
jgi:hypothetical protein